MEDKLFSLNMLPSENKDYYYYYYYYYYYFYYYYYHLSILTDVF